MKQLLAVDWGTSSLRGALLDRHGKVLQERAFARGILSVPPGEFATVFEACFAPWTRAAGTFCLISGMAGSRQGWIEAPYCACPAGFDDIARRLAWVTPGRIAIVPGLCCERDGIPDVMRGEETQLLGALALRPALIPDSTWILPGTHSKWARVRDGAVTDFCTLMTGELFALLRQHSILCAGSGDAAVDPDAFARGVIAARDSGSAGAFTLLFSARALMLDNALAPDAVPEYLSGLLIGEEMRSSVASNRFRHDAPLQLIGDAALSARYRLAVSHFDLELAEPVVDAAAHGLWQIACNIGLVSAGSSTASEETSAC